MNTAIKNAKKTLAVLLCVLMFSAFAVPSAGAEGSITWNVKEGGYTVTVPKDADGVSVVKGIPEATTDVANGEIEYKLIYKNGENEEEITSDGIVLSGEKTEVAVKNIAKAYIFSKDIDQDGKITVYLRASCGDLPAVDCPIVIENYKVTATFSYLNDKHEYVDLQTEVYYGQSAEGYSETIKDFSRPENDENCHYIKKGWVDFWGESEIDRVMKDTTFVLSFSSEAHKINTGAEDYVLTPATCTNAGEESGECKVCGISMSTVIPALGHEKVVDEAGVAATCLVDGKTEAWHCSRKGCDYKVESKPIPAIGSHTEVVDAAVEATCTKEGLTEGKHCSVCGEKTVEQKTVQMKAHEYVEMDAKEATCDDNGYKAGKRCSVCGVPESDDMIIPASGHDYEDVDEVPAECEKDGRTAGKKCKRCEKVEGCKVIEAPGHQKTEIKEEKDPTCTETGLTEGYTCSVCGKVVEQTVIPVIPHTEVIDEAVAATCTEKGKTEGKHCSVCNTVIEPQKETDALGHDMVVTKEGYEETCTEKGFTDEKKCSRCDVVEEQTEIPPKGHSLVTEYGRDATCTEDGESDCVFCTVCGHVEKEREVIKNFGGHKDLDNDGFCDRCGTEVEKPQSGNTCGCICHKGGIVGWLWKSILCPIIKFLGIEQKCKCGVDHWTK